MFKNIQGFSDVIVMTIIGGILGSLFILGVFVWKEVEIANTTNNIRQLVSKVSDVEERSEKLAEDNKLVEEDNNVEITTNYLPSGWIIENNIFYSPEMYNAREGGPYSLLIKVNDQFDSIDNYFKDETLTEECFNNKNSFTLNGNNVIQFTLSCGHIPSEIILMEMNGVLIEGVGYPFSDEREEIKKIFSSLKLINKTIMDTSNWQTYTNEEYGFSLKYPSDWNVLVGKKTENEPLSGNRISVRNNDDWSFLICPEGDCLLFQDGGHRKDFEQEISIDNLKANLTYYVKDEDFCSKTECSEYILDTIEISLINIPSGWSEGRNFVLRNVSQGVTSIPEKILSTFKFLDEEAKENCCCQYLTDDIINEDLLFITDCNDRGGNCIQVDSGRLTPHPCCPDAKGATCSS